MRESFDAVDGASSADESRWPLSAVLFPPPFFCEEEEKAADERLWNIERATEAVLTADGAIVRLLAEFGVNADMMVGHSAGEWVALAASGVLDTEELISSMGRLTAGYRNLDEADIPRMAMLAVGAGREKVEAITGAMNVRVYIANDNCPHQVVIVVDPGDADAVSHQLVQKGVFVERLSFDRGYHTPIFTYMCEPLRECFSAMRIGAPSLPLHLRTTRSPIRRTATPSSRWSPTPSRAPCISARPSKPCTPMARAFSSRPARAAISRFRRRHSARPPAPQCPRRIVVVLRLLSAASRAGDARPAAHACSSSICSTPPFAGRLTWDLAPTCHPTRPTEPGSMRLSLLYPELQRPTEPLPPRIVRETVHVPASEAEPSRNGHPTSPNRSPRFSTPTSPSCSVSRYPGSRHERPVRRPCRNRRRRRAVVASPRTEHRRDPLLCNSAVVKHEPGQEIVLRVTIDASEHLYLEDHCLYIRYPVPETAGTGLFFMPLTGSLELLAEAAGMFAPGKTVVNVRDILAPRWLDVEESGPPTVVEVTARRLDESSVRATLRNGTSVLTECTVVFADGFPEALAPMNLTLENERAPKAVGDQIYTHRHMFHGPRFQGVTGVERVGEDGVLGGLRVLPYDNLLRADTNPGFHLDFYLLDAAGQLVGYWPSEFYTDGIVSVPVRVAEVQLYRRDLKPGERCSGRAHIRGLTQRGFIADFDVVGPDGQLWMRVIGWEDWRFHWGSHNTLFWRLPQKGGIGVPLQIPALAEAEIECRRFDPPLESDKTGLWEKLLMRLMLTTAELREYQALPTAAERSEWAILRACARDTAHGWIKRVHGRELYPSQISEGPDGRVRLFHADGLRAPYVSVDRHKNTAVGVAGARPIAIAIAPDAESARQAAARKLTGGSGKIATYTVPTDNLTVAVAQYQES